MSKFTFLHETPDHFVLHNGKASFHVAKKGITEPTADKIRSFADGGNVEDPRNKQTTMEAQIELAEKEKRAQTTPEPTDYVKYNNPDKFAQGGEADEKPDAELGSKVEKLVEKHFKENATSEKKEGHHLVYKNKGGKLYADGGQVDTSDNKDSNDDITPMEEIQMYKHGKDVTNEDERAQYRAMKQLKKESNLPMYDDGGSVQSFQDSFRKATHYADGGTAAATPEVTDVIQKAARNPQQVNDAPIDPDEEAARQEKYRKIRETNTANMQNGNYAQGGNIRNELQTQAIKRYADGNPATLDKGGYVHNNAGKNQLHFHFYDEGATQQPSALDKYVGNKPAQGTPLDNYAEEGSVASEPTDSDKLEQSAQNVQAGLNSQTPTSDNSADTEGAPPATGTGGSWETASEVPQSQQIPAVQKPLPPTPDQSPSMLTDFDKSLALEKSGIEQGANAQSEGYKQTAQLIGQNVLQQKQMQDAYKLEADKITQQNTQLFNAVASSKVDPNHFWNSKSTGGKIMATIGVLLGGAASGMNGGSGQNQGLISLQNHIQQDIEAQKNDQSNKMNLYKMGLERYRDAQSAQQFATLQSNALLQGQLQKIAAQTGSQTSMATAQQMIGQLGVQNAGIRSELAMKQAAFGAMNQPQPAQTGVDPNKMRLLINAGVIPKEEVPTAMKEYGEYQKLNTVLDNTDKTFDIGRKNANWRQAILPHWTPDLTQASKQYDASIDNFLGKITKETEGRVTPADVELMRPSMPSFTDSPETAQQKLNTVKDQIKEKYTFPTLQSYRLLHPNNPTAMSSATRKKQFSESKPQ